MRARSYFSALRDEIRLYHERGFRYDEVYVGGGTPTLDGPQLVKTLALVHQLSAPKRISVETNPKELTPDLVDALQAAGVDRLSIGVQTFDDDLLDRLGRRKSYGTGSQIKAKLAAIAGRFRTINIDMMFNLPGQSRASLAADLEAIKRLPIEQVSYYPLMAEAARLEIMRQQMGGGPATNEHRYYDLIRDQLARDFVMGSAWCFSRGDGQLDEYITTSSEYLGLGSGAMGYLNGTFYSNTFSVNGYIERIGLGLSGVTGARHLTAEECLQYEFLVGLFATRLAKAALKERHGADFRQRLRWPILALKLAGALRETDDGFELTPSGLYIWVVMMREFFNGVNEVRGQMRKQIFAERVQLAQLT